MAHEEVGKMRAHLCACSCAHGLEEVLNLESEVVVGEDEVDNFWNMLLQILVYSMFLKVFQGGSCAIMA